jgi:hypothetical protein
LLCKKISVPKSKEVKLACNLATSFMEGFDTKRAVLPMMMMMIMMKGLTRRNEHVFNSKPIIVVWRSEA